MPKITEHGGVSDQTEPGYFDGTAPSSPTVRSDHDETPEQYVPYEPEPDDTEDPQRPEGTDYPSWSYKDLLAELKRRELPRGGNAAELADRLKADDWTTGN